MFCKMLQNSQENDCSCLILCYFELIPKNEGGVGGGGRTLFWCWLKNPATPEKLFLSLKVCFSKLKPHQKYKQAHKLIPGSAHVHFLYGATLPT